MKTRHLALTTLIALVTSFAFVAPAAAQSLSWRSVQALGPGERIVVSRDGFSGAPDRTVVFADADVLVVLNLTGLDLNERDVTSLVRAADTFTRPTPGRASETVSVDTARIAADGVWIGTQRLGDVAQRLERIPRTAVAEIRKPGRRVGSKVGAIAGGAGGALIGVGIAIGIATENPCGSSCSDEKALAFTSAIGLPIGAGLLGYHAFGHRTSELIYRR